MASIDGYNTGSYVDIGVTDNSAITVHKKTFNTIVVIVIIIIIILIILVIVFSIIYVNSQVGPKPSMIIGPGVPSELHSDHNRIDGTYNQGIEPHGMNYFNIGQVSSVVADLKLLQASTKRECESLCDTSNSNAYIWNSGSCYTVTGGVQGIATYNRNSNNGLYMKNRGHFSPSNKIYLSHNRSSLPPRYWLDMYGSNYSHIPIGIIVVLNFYPSFYSGPDKVIGIISPYQFSVYSVKDIIKAGSSNYIYVHNDEYYSIPERWRYYKKFYIYYILN